MYIAKPTTQFGVLPNGNRVQLNKTLNSSTVEQPKVYQIFTTVETTDPLDGTVSTTHRMSDNNVTVEQLQARIDDLQAKIDAINALDKVVEETVAVVK